MVDNPTIPTPWSPAQTDTATEALNQRRNNSTQRATIAISPTQILQQQRATHETVVHIYDRNRRCITAMTLPDVTTISQTIARTTANNRARDNLQLLTQMSPSSETTLGEIANDQ
eukprot:817638-Prorocentrum_lima.AAC.1